MATEKTLLGMDIGTGWIRAAVCSVSKDGIMVESISERQSDGVKNGSVVNIDQTLKVINQVISDVEQNAGFDAKSVVLGIGGDHIGGLQSTGVVGIHSRGYEIKREDINKSIDVAKARDLPRATEVIHTIVQDFKVDATEGIKDPIDMTGHRLETNVFIVTCSSSVAQNLKRCVQKAGVQVQRMILESLADSEAVLSKEEKESGVLVINIGSGITNTICYLAGSPHYVGGINLGGENITNDISYMLQLPRSAAESLKISQGSAHTPSCRSDETVTTPSVGGKPAILLPKTEFAKIIEARMAEIYVDILNSLNSSGLNGTIGSGVVITGGGALLSGATELASEIFRLPARIGFPEAINGLDRTYIDPRYTTLIGLLKLEAKKYIDNNSSFSSANDGKIGGKMKSLLSKLF